MARSTDTIAAIATPVGEGGLAVIRLSGPAAVSIARDRFHGADLGGVGSHTAHLGTIVSASGSDLDQAVATVFRAPHSYTGEDVVEFSCHGGGFVSRRLLDELLASGARLAEPGEFTKRAFLNGRMDLAQAEAVADLIHSRSEAARRVSLAQLRGTLSEHVGQLRSSLIDAVGLLELELDFAEEGYELIDRTKVLRLVERARAEVETLAASYSAGRIYRDGVRVVLAGAPNAGKSSLLNALLRESRAIVTEVPGTTRDVILENITIGGVLFRIADTAGLRPTADPVEREGVRRTAEELADADIVVLVVDLSRDAAGQLKEVGEGVLKDLGRQGRRSLVALNKVDLTPQVADPDLSRLGSLGLAPRFRISAETRAGIQEFEQGLLRAILPGGMETTDSPTIVSSRHHQALTGARNSLDLATESLRTGKSSDLVAVDLRGALDGLGQITGQVTTDDILSSVFSRFCIGK